MRFSSEAGWMNQDCPEKEQLEREWTQALDLASELEKQKRAVILEGRQANPGLAAMVLEAWERADSAWKSLDIHCVLHGCDMRNREKPS
jgi:hypothetical protein